MLRIAKDLANAQPDYISHRALLFLLTGVGATTAKGVADQCVAHHQNFHDLFYLAVAPQWLNARQSAAVARVWFAAMRIRGSSGRHWTQACKSAFRNPRRNLLLKRVEGFEMAIPQSLLASARAIPVSPYIIPGKIVQIAADGSVVAISD